MAYSEGREAEKIETERQTRAVRAWTGEGSGRKQKYHTNTASKKTFHATASIDR